jgi:ABC-three component (ABC-3C) system Middle Component 3
MLPWHERPIEIATLLNPSFCGSILAAATVGYSEANEQGLPLALAFLVLPCVLHRQTREGLPRTTRTSLAAWLQEKPDLKVGFFERALSLKSFTREGLVFGLSQEIVRVTNDGKVVTEYTSKSVKDWAASLKDETGDCLSKAHFAGRWFSLSGTAETVIALWGVSP